MRKYVRLTAISLLLLFGNFGIANADATLPRAADALPDNLGSFHASAPAQSSSDSAAARAYVSVNGQFFRIEITREENDAAAFASLTYLAGEQGQIQSGKVGIATVEEAQRILFYQGNFVVHFDWTGSPSPHEEMVNTARAFAARLPAGDDEIPVLVKHLPPGQTSAHPYFAMSLEGLKKTPVQGQPILEVLDFDGGTEAVIANYGPAQLAIVEFTTPQFSIANDQRIWSKISELKSKGQSTPTAYRRVGNYSVFVFNAPDEKTANALVDQVKYEQVVQWLGDDPHLYERLQRYFTQTSAGVLVAVLKSSGLSLLLCLAAGALIGTMMFRHRRAQKAAAYSDGGGSIRLNLDDLTGPVTTTKFLKSGKPSEHSPKL